MESAKKLGVEFDSIYYADYYTPNKPLVQELIDEINCFYRKNRPSQKDRRDAGYKLEELALAVFHGLSGWFSIKSFQSSTAQYDLLMSGEGPEWEDILQLLTIDPRKYAVSIVVEAKATKARVDDAQFARLCSLMQNNLKKRSVLGIFFTLNGASGFPIDDTKAVKSIGYSRLRQLLFYAETNKPIVVLDIHDIQQLTENGSLLRILSRKIMEIEEQTGLPTCKEKIKEVLLPENLEKLYKKLNSLQT